MLSLFRGVGLGYSPMLHKCANPDCSQPFKYFRHGKLFSFEMKSRSGIPEKSKKMRKVLWPCGRCVRRMTLKFGKESGERAGCYSAGTSRESPNYLAGEQMREIAAKRSKEFRVEKSPATEYRGLLSRSPRLSGPLPKRASSFNPSSQTFPPPEGNDPK